MSSDMEFNRAVRRACESLHGTTGDSWQGVWGDGDVIVLARGDSQEKAVSKARAVLDSHE